MKRAGLADRKERENQKVWRNPKLNKDSEEEIFEVNEEEENLILSLRHYGDQKKLAGSILGIQETEKSRMTSFFRGCEQYLEVFLEGVPVEDVVKHISVKDFQEKLQGLLKNPEKDYVRKAVVLFYILSKY